MFTLLQLAMLERALFATRSTVRRAKQKEICYFCWPAIRHRRKICKRFPRLHAIRFHELPCLNIAVTVDMTTLRDQCFVIKLTPPPRPRRESGPEAAGDAAAGKHP
ncbi:hypothetical protein GCM10010249_16960 [Streptomyces roseolilacinus]|uniref:Uncharacterized protein n=1 Tax=Streptomyces roseolilacinus TaxID=66904 RepID=A0A918AXP5_9ACTN|nr:hypothetical protein GCM10010249_16960 [Streptomyces roseolilacinus]